MEELLILDSGSFRAQQYANDHPKRVGLFVLDAVIPHGRVGLSKAIESWY